jgi:hypothetical protein
MLEILELLIHFIITFIKLLKPGGVKVVMAERKRKSLVGNHKIRL